MKNDNKQLITFVVPAFNEEENIPQLYEELTDFWGSNTKYLFELIFVNDGSRDDSWSAINKIAKSDKRVKAVKFSRNFGHQAALEAGLQASVGDAVIMMDCDGQHPVSVVPKLISEWEDGYDIVNTIREDTEGASFFKRVTANFFYGMMSKFSDTNIIPSAADFRLIDRRVVDVLKSFPEDSKFYRGLINWVGFKTTYVLFKAKKRVHGISGYTFQRMYKFATDGLTGFSNFPLKIAKYIGLFIVSTGILCLLYMIITTITDYSKFPTWVYLIVFIYFLNGMQFIVLWFIGNYIGRIYNQQKGRPSFIISDRINA